MITKECPKGLINAIHYWCPDFKSTEMPIIAGGFIRAYYAGETPSDMDVYFRNENDAKTILAELEAAGWEKVFETEMALTIKKNGRLIQLVRCIYGDPADIIDNFDFTVCCAAARIDLEKVYLHDNFFEHLAARLLVFQGSKLPLASLKRTIKYIKRGYHICDENIIRLAESIAEAVDFKDETSVQEHIAGMDPDGEGRRIRVID